MNLEAISSIPDIIAATSLLQAEPSNHKFTKYLLQEIKLNHTTSPPLPSPSAVRDHSLPQSDLTLIVSSIIFSLAFALTLAKFLTSSLEENEF